MKKTILLFSTFLALGLSAEEKSRLSVGVLGGEGFPRSPSTFSAFKNAGFYGLQARYDLSTHWSFGARAQNFSFKSKEPPADKITSLPVTATAFLFLTRGFVVNPYITLSAGPGRVTFRTADVEKQTTRAAFSVGAGVEIPLSEANALGLEGSLDRINGASSNGKNLQYARASAVLIFHIPDDWVPVRSKRPLPSENFDSGRAGADGARHQLQEYLDKILRDIQNGQVQPIAFENNASHLKTSSYEALDLIGAVLRRYPRVTVKITGFAAPDETQKDPVVLSQARADVARAYLIQNFHIRPNKLFSVPAPPPSENGPSPFQMDFQAVP